MAENAKDVKRKVQVLIEVPLKTTALNEYVALFKAMNGEVEKLHKNLGTLNQPSFRPKQVQELLKRQFNQGKKGPAAVAELFGFTEQDVRTFAAGIKRAMNAAGDFASLPKAQQVAMGMLKSRAELTGAVLSNLKGMGTTIGPTELGKKAADVLTAEIGKMTQALTNALNGRNAQGQFTGGGAGAAAGDGTDPTPGRGRTKKRGPLKGAPSVAEHPEEIGRTVTQTEDAVRTVVRQRAGLDSVVATTFDELKNEIKKVTTTTHGKGALENVQHAEALIKESMRGGKAGLRRGDLLGLAQMQESAAREFEKLLTDELSAALGPQRFTKIAERIRAKADTLKRSARANRAASPNWAWGSQGAASYADVAMSGNEATGQRVRAEAEAAELERIRRDNVRSRQRRAMDAAKAAGAPPLIPPPELPGAPPPTMGQRAIGLAGTFVRNTAKVSMWSASVGALYGSLDVAKDAMRTIMETELQTKRLGQVFRGAGGDAKQLTSDVLGLAAAEGRSRDEAMESAVSWSRLGLTRRQVNMAVRESLIAANVAEIDAGEATTKLQAIMAAYGLQVEDLHGLLGQLNETSNTFNVTNKDMLEGLTRTASVAKQAGMPLQELIGMLGAGIGTTGQSGANMGNAIKSILVSLSNPEIQKYLRYSHNLEVTKEGGREMKPMNEVFAEIYGKYQGMSGGQRQMFLQQIAGKTQASRLAATLDSYVQGQVLAIESQRRLNSAEEENLKIKESLISKIRTLRSEWDQLLVDQGQNNGLTGMLGGFVQGGTSGLRLLKRFGDSKWGVNPILKGASAAQVVDDFLTKHFPTADDVQRKTLFGFMERQQEGLGSARSAGQAANLFETVRLAMRGARDPGKILEGMEGLHFNDPQALAKLKGAAGARNFAETDRILTKEAEAAREQGKAARAREAAAIEETKAYYRAQVDGEKDPQKRAGWLADLQKLESRKTEIIKEFMEDDALEQFKEATLQGMIHTERTKMALQQIAEIYRSIPAATTGSRMALDALSLGEQERLLKGRLAGLDAAGLAPQETARIRKEWTDQLERVQAERAATNSPEAIAAAQRADRTNVAVMMAGSAADRFTFGESRMDQLQNRIAGTQLLLQAQERLSREGETQLQRENAMAQAQALRADITSNQLEMERERGKLVQTEFEYARKLLTSGPQELMNQLLANRMLKQSGGLTAGMLLGFSPEMRQALLDQEQSRRRRAFLGQTPSVEGLQGALGLTSSLRLGNFGAERGLGRDFKGEKEQFADALNAAAVDLGVLKESANGAAEGLDGLQRQLQAVTVWMEDWFLRGGGGSEGGWETRTGAPGLSQGLA